MQQRLMLALAVVIGCACVVESRERRTSQTSHRYFDEFLLSVVSNGFVPPSVGDVTLNNDRSAAERRPTQPRQSAGVEQSDNGEQAGSTNPLHESLRNYIRRNHEESRNEDLTTQDSTATSESATSESSGSLPSASADNKIFSLALQRLMSEEPEPRRHHNRRNLDQGVSSEFAAISANMRNVPKSHWSCCSLGQLAGDKGFLCDAQFYASRVLDRNANRVHNRRLTGTYFNDGQPTQSGRDIINLFNSCVRSLFSAHEFTSCCETSFAEYQDRRERWNDFRTSIQS